jgi:F-type H+-transporting ATPase subunit b
MIDIDWTLVAQLVNFLLLVFLLNMVLFRPIRNSLKERQAKLASQEADLEGLLASGQGVNQDIQDRLREARKEALGHKEGLLKEGAQAEASLLEAVKKEVDAEWAKVEQKIKKDMAKARETLKKQAQDFAQMLASKILGREVS